MGWFGRNKETSENENPESEVGGLGNEVSEEEENPEAKLSSGDRNRDFRESLKVEPKEDDGTAKLDTGNDGNDGDEPGPRERSLPEELEGDER